MSNLKDHLLSSAESRVLAQIYENSNYLEINNSRPAGKPDSRMYSMDLALLKEYLSMIEEEMRKKGIDQMGVKITLGKYPEKSDNPKIKKEYLGYQTLFISALDLGEPSAKNLLLDQQGESVNSTEDIPDFNYMSLTPP